MSKINDIIELSVGGQMFKTTRRTLVSEPNSVLADMFEFADDSANVGAKNEENGALFIDRDPKYFSVVLNYLRNKKVEMKKDIDLNYLMEEAKFYGIQGMVEILEKDQQEKKKADRQVQAAFNNVCDTSVEYQYGPTRTGNPQLDFQIAQAFQLKMIADQISEIESKYKRTR